MTDRRAPSPLEQGRQREGSLRRPGRRVAPMALTWAGRDPLSGNDVATSIFTAVKQEPWSESRPEHGTRRALFVDRIERPSPNQPHAPVAELYCGVIRCPRGDRSHNGASDNRARRGRSYRLSAIDCRLRGSRNHGSGWRWQPNASSHFRDGASRQRTAPARAMM
jgi:hypothetical protein